MEADISGLRKEASQSSLATDQRLLDTLQHIHQKLVSLSSETNTKLQAMMRSLDDASVALHNTNNTFMELSNSQFIESRVYDDDDIQTDTQSTDAKPLPAPNRFLMLSNSLQVLESLHETISILPDSESSDDDDEEDLTRVVLKPKDLYSSRPLPYIIGSSNWRNKWHAGVLVEESESESCSSRQSVDLEQYSQSEDDTPAIGPRHQLSTPSSASGSALLSPSDVANQLAQRLRGTLTQVPQSAPSSPEPPAARKVYGVEKTPAATIFPDEPPPLSVSDESESDIFAELRRDNVPYGAGNRVHSATAAEDLFGQFNDEPPPLPSTAKRNTPLFQDELEPESIHEPNEEIVRSDNSIKKPVGGKSLFGSNMNNESIGAAILKRHQRKSSSESDDSCQTPVGNIKSQSNYKESAVKENVEKKDGSKERSIEKDLIEDLFAKPTVKNESKEHKTKTVIVKKKENQNTDIFEDLFAKSQSIQKKETAREQKTVEKKPDLFSDNIFDDIDNIFTSNVSKVTLKEPNREQATNSLFDDDDDLFKDIGENETKNETKPEYSIKGPANVKESQQKKETKSIFDSDDELFTDTVKTDVLKEPVKAKKVRGSEEKLTGTKSEVKSVTKVAKSIFDDDNDDDIFTNMNVTKNNHVEITKSDAETSVKVVQGSINSDKVSNLNKTDIFGDEDDDESLFFNKVPKRETPKVINEKLKTVKEQTKPYNSPNLFDDDDDDLFTVSSKKIDIRTSKHQNSPPKLDKETKEIIEQDKLGQITKTDTVKETTNNFENKELLQEDTSMVSKENDSNEDDVTSNKSDDWETDDKITEVISPANIFGTKNLSTSKSINETLEKKNNKTLENIEDSDIARKVITKTEITTKEDNKPTDIETVFLDKEDSDSSISMKYDVTQSDVFEKFKEQTNSNAPDFEHGEGNSNKVDTISSEAINQTVGEVNKAKTDIITSIFNDQPPVFEKPKEPKRSKNINALFDDDSDDEALFFKKNDTLVDDTEKPDTPFIASDTDSTSNARLFGLFHDEPPAIDVDFVQKSKANVNKDFVDKPASDLVEDDISKPSKLNKSILDDFDEGDIFKPTKEDKSTLETNAAESDVSDAKKDNQEIAKKVGKLKPVNLNINVKTLLPGASPKKITKPLEQPDGQTVSRSNEELKTEIVEDIEPKITKSVSFEGEHDSSILDSKLSKERARIQVKRRPSTRKARREAVKKSGIDFGDDTIDSSNVDQNDLLTRDVLKAEEKESQRGNTRSDETVPLGTNGIDKNIESFLSTEQIPDTTRDTSIESPSIDKINQISDNLSKLDENNKQNPTKDVKSKVVYILNDEDIFTDNNNASTSTSKDTIYRSSKIDSQKEKTDVTSTKTYDQLETKSDPVTENALPRQQILNIIDDEEDIFKTMIKETQRSKIKETTEAKPEPEGIKTLGKVYSEETRTEISKPSAVESDDDIFKDITPKPKSTEQHKQKNNTRTELLRTESQVIDEKNQKPEQTSKTEASNSKPKSIFDDLSDSEAELFGTKPNKIENFGTKTKKVDNKKYKPLSKKESLFDSDSEDDLFGAQSKTKERSKKSQEVGRSEKKEVEVNAVKKIEIKGSLFGDYEDEDLFSVRKSSERKSKPENSREVLTKPVFDDPLSLLGSDDE